MKHKLLNKLLFLTLLTLGGVVINPAWADTKTDVMFAKGFGGSTTTSYSSVGTDYTAVANSTNATGVQYTMQVFNGSNGQVKGNGSGSANFSCRNTTSYEGYYISSVSLTVKSGSIDGSTSGRSVVYFGSSVYANPNTTAPSGTYTSASPASSSQKTLTWTNTDESVSYFILYNLKTTGSAYCESSITPLTVVWTKKTPVTHTLTYSASNGSIAGVDAESSAVASGDDVAEGATVTLTATPSDGYEFSSWEVSGTGSNLSSTSSNPTTFTMGTANATVTANFVVASAVSTPTFSPASGSAVYYGTKVTATCATDDADLYYTLTTNGTTPADPTDASTAYPDGGIAITANTVNIKVIAKKGSDYSSVASATYTLQKPAEPTFSPAAGAVARGTTVTISSAAGTSIVYTTDGSDADTGTDVGTNSVNVTIDDAMTIKAIAYDPELNMSSEASAAYTIAQVATPTFSVAAGAVAKGTTVELACVTEGATIHYTRDGSTPTASSPTYSSAITLNYGQTIKAIAVKANYIDSEVASATYTITGGSETLDLTTLSDGTKPSTINGTDVSYTFSVGTGSSAPQYYSSGNALRFYQNNTLTIASATKTISSIAIRFTQNSQNMSLVVGQPGTLGSGSGVGTRTWTGNASSVQFTTDPACRFDYITVTYAPVDDRTPCVTSLDLATKSFPKDDAGTLTATATENGSLTGDVTYTFSSNDAEVLGVEEDGTYKAKAIGTVKVTVTASPAAADLDLFKPVVAEVDVKVTGTTTMALSDTEDIKEFDTPITFTVTGLADGYDGDITVSSGTPSVATASIEGNIVTVTPVKVGTTVITVTAPATDLYLGTVNREFTAYFDQPAGKTTAPTDKFVKVTATGDITDGDYLIVYEGSKVAFDGSLVTLDASSNTIDVTISGGEIEASDECLNAVFTIDVANGTLKSASNKYIGTDTNSNTLKQSDESSTYTNSFSIDGSGNAVISAVFDGSNRVLRYNKTSGQERFRYFGGTQENIQLYKFEGSEAPQKTLNAYGYATYCCEYPLDFTDAESNGYSAWQVTDVSDGVITFAQITGKVKGGTPVLLKGTANATINMTACDSENNISGTNKLKGTLAETYLTQVDGSYINFGLSGNQFKKVADGTVVPKGKAYLPVLTSEISAVKAFTFFFDDDDATSIESIQDSRFKIQDEEAIYNLAGQRISKMQKGINIVNGKKILK